MFKKTLPLEIVKTELRNLTSIFKNTKETLNKVSNALLSWSYGSIETNRGLAQAFSCLADLDYAYGQLIQQICDKTDEYRKALKDIWEKESDLRQLESRTTKNVKQWQQKMDKWRNNDRGNGLEMLNMAQKVEDAARSLKAKQDEFEVYKAKTVHDAVIKYNTECLQIMNNMQIIFQCKADISELVSETPVKIDHSLPDGNTVVQNALKKVSLDLPVREAVFGRETFNTNVISVHETLKSPPGTPQSPSIKLHTLTSTSVRGQDRDTNTTTEPEYHYVAYNEKTTPDPPRMPPNFGKMHSFEEVTISKKSGGKNTATPEEPQFYASSDVCEPPSRTPEPLPQQIENTYFDSSIEASSQGDIENTYFDVSQETLSQDNIENTYFEGSQETSSQGNNENDGSHETSSQGDIENIYSDVPPETSSQYNIRNPYFLNTTRPLSVQNDYIVDMSKQEPIHGNDNKPEKTPNQDEIPQNTKISTEPLQSVSEDTKQQHIKPHKPMTKTKFEESEEVDDLKLNETANTSHISSNVTDPNDTTPKQSEGKVKPQPRQRVKKKPVITPRVERR
ncbi:uncharacterized protein [Amphiura filiformis]|uniref:uncharacterized protein n=1 Tax=Amphiura filiformis TaxID=82378 RepID=UPI003B222D9B